MASKVKGRSAPNIPEHSLRTDCGDLTVLEDLYSCRICDEVLKRLPGSIETCIFDGASIVGSSVRNIKVYDTAFRQCDLANVDAANARFDRVELIGCRLTCINLAESHLKDVLFRECQSRLAIYRFARVAISEFQNCDLRESDFSNADLRGSLFSGCDLTGIDMSNAKLSGTDIRGCKIEGIKMNTESAKGLIIDPGQAIFLIHLLGVKIHWN